MNSAKGQESSLIADARKESNSIMKETEKKIEEMKEKGEQETKRIIDTIKRQELASAELENKKIVLEAKKQTIDNVFIKVGKLLEKLDDKKKESYIKKLLEKIKSDIEIGHFYCNKRDAKFLKGFNAEIIDVIGGLLAENKEKTLRVDYSFETLLQSIKENELQNVNKILFG